MRLRLAAFSALFALFVPLLAHADQVDSTHSTHFVAASKGGIMQCFAEVLTEPRNPYFVGCLLAYQTPEGIHVDWGWNRETMTPFHVVVPQDALQPCSSQQCGEGVDQDSTGGLHLEAMIPGVGQLDVTVRSGGLWYTNATSLQFCCTADSEGGYRLDSDDGASSITLINQQTLTGSLNGEAIQGCWNQRGLMWKGPVSGEILANFYKGVSAHKWDLGFVEYCA